MTIITKKFSDCRLFIVAVDEPRDQVEKAASNGDIVYPIYTCKSVEDVPDFSDCKNRYIIKPVYIGHQIPDGKSPVDCASEIADQLLAMSMTPLKKTEIK